VRPLLLRTTILAIAGVLVAACGGLASPAATPGAPYTLRLGYLTNLTHGSAFVGLSKGYLAGDLPRGATIQSQAFNAGPAEVEAILGGALDAGFFGPSPAINAFVRTKGQAVRIVAGATSGGAGLVVRPELNIHSAADLRGRSLATPQLGNTQDVALRAYLADHGLKTDPQGGGDVRIVPTDNATTLQLFKQGKVDGAWVPEPWTSRLQVEARGQLLVDEASLWPQGKFATTELVVTKTLLDRRPDIVQGLLRGHLEATDWVQQHPDEAKAAASAALESATSSKLADAVLTPAWSRLTFTVDPQAGSFKKEAADARRVGLLGDDKLNGIIDARPLDAILKEAGRPPVDTAGLGPA
jgi:NitT/TauT family transport system substrate-binding protein